MTAIKTELRLVSGVAYLRLPNTWAMEFTQNVPCHSSTVDRKNPTTSPLQPPIRKHSVPRNHGPMRSYLLRKRSSGNLAKSSISSYNVSVDVCDRIQPQCAHQKPRW